MDNATIHDGGLRLDGWALEQLEAVICSGGASLAAAECRWLLAVAEFDRREGWESWGLVGTAAWLSWKVGLDIRAAREKVRVGRALARFPKIAAAMGEGRLSYSKVRAITRIADPDTEDDLVELALNKSTNLVERIVATHRRAEARALAEEGRSHELRGLHFEQNDDDTITISVRLTTEVGKVVLSAVESFTGPPVLDASGLRVGLAQRRADGLVAMAEAANEEHINADGQAPYLLSIHVDDGVLEGDNLDGRCEVEGIGDSGVAQGISVETARRIACDSAVQLVGDDGWGGPRWLGKRTRIVRGRLKRAVKLRDRGCRYPSCTARGRVDCHHIIHNHLGGPTRLENLLSLCRFHHHLVHEGGWRVIVDGPNGELAFVSPDGRLVPARPPVNIGSPILPNVYPRPDDDDGWGQAQFELGLAVDQLFADLAARSAHSPGSARDRPPWQDGGT